MNIVDRITATGADDSVFFEMLLRVTRESPLLEWGILVSKNAMGSPRFPSQKWLDGMYHEHPKAQFSCHLCGTWVKELCFEGRKDFMKVLQMNLFQRIQLNFHAIVHQINRERFIKALKMLPSYQFIFQLDDVNNSILDVALDAGINAVPLFDTSGGAGIVPKAWPEFVPKTGSRCYCGYAGGLCRRTSTAKWILSARLFITLSGLMQKPGYDPRMTRCLRKTRSEPILKPRRNGQLRRNMASRYDIALGKLSQPKYVVPPYTGGMVTHTNDQEISKIESEMIATVSPEMEAFDREIQQARARCAALPRCVKCLRRQLESDLPAAKDIDGMGKNLVRFYPCFHWMP